MQFTTTILAFALAAGSLAAPTFQSNDNSVVVTLIRNHGRFVRTRFHSVQNGVREEEVPRRGGPFAKVNLHVGKGVQKQDLRCQVLDEEGNPIVILRDPNVDITFSDADKGAWTFRHESKVSKVVCDPTFAKIDEKEKNTVVILRGNHGRESETTFVLGGAAREALPPSHIDGPFNEVEIKVGALVEKQDLRCKVKNNHGRVIIAKRGENVDKTFSDAKKGPWKFVKPEESKVHEIICDPAFVAEKVQI